MARERTRGESHGKTDTDVCVADYFFPAGGFFRSPMGCVRCFARRYMGIVSCTRLYMSVYIMLFEIVQQRERHVSPVVRYRI